MKWYQYYTATINVEILTSWQMTISTVPYYRRCCQINCIVVVVVTTAVVVVRLCIVVVVVTAMVALWQIWYQVVSRVKVTEWKFNYFVRLDPAAIVKLKPFQMYYLQNKFTINSSTSVMHCDNGTLNDLCHVYFTDQQSRRISASKLSIVNKWNI